MTWFQQAPLSQTQVSSDRCLTSGMVSSLPPQLLEICPRGLVMGPNWVIHYKVVLSSWRQLTDFSLWGGRFLGIFFLSGNILVVCGRLKFTWVVHLSPFLYTLAFSVNFHTLICYHWLLRVNHWDIFFLCVLGGYFDDNLTILCGNALSQFQFLWGHWVHNFCLEISFHCFVNLESVIFWQLFVAIFTRGPFGLRVLSLPASVCVCVCLSVCVSTFARPDDNSSPVQARFT